MMRGRVVACPLPVISPTVATPRSAPLGACYLGHSLQKRPGCSVAATNGVTGQLAGRVGPSNTMMMRSCGVAGGRSGSEPEARDNCDTTPADRGPAHSPREHGPKAFQGPVGIVLCFHLVSGLGPSIKPNGNFRDIRRKAVSCTQLQEEVGLDSKPPLHGYRGSASWRCPQPEPSGTRSKKLARSCTDSMPTWNRS
jgi:hypothetical protein